MFRYTLKRLGWAIVTLWAVITITFLLMHSIPGNPFAKEGTMPEAVYNNLQHYYNLDKPLVVQYGLYLKQLAQFDFGPSLKSKTITVNDYIVNGFPVSLHLGMQALVIAITFGLIFGVIASLNRNRWPDYVSMVLSIIGISVPSFILATFLINFVAVEWGLLPVATWQSWSHTVLPSISLAMMPMAYIARLMRSSMLEVLGQDYINTARAKGIAKHMIIFKHAIRNAILPVVTVLGIITANLVTGSFIIEQIFGIPGMGEMFVKGIFNRDYPVILGSTIFYAAILIFLVFIVDIAYTFIDPRIKITGESK
ncbi:ABC transporter permease subunit [Pontibacillus yanchengensis]|uniref:ABC transporter permease subunit n=2 Tax=Pontibacillus yanchengensis TaxID=462910 RepID=A0ACC7VE70_9BACI|nr:ABC transporter permease [Pontibacillus yanchengensis]MYL35132.1 ABC transporter permease subunit [Pontibacillus yanchengensis]MYL52501.1 ABC transporter permease subunit [Pontibacillus yanchengensis]